MMLPISKLLSLEGILHEFSPDGINVVLWLPGTHHGHFVDWERLATTPGAKVVSDGEVAMVAASSLTVRQEVRGVLGRLWRSLRGPTDEHEWILPNGQTATQYGDRQTDLYLVWAVASASLDEQQLRQRWPDRKRLERIGPNLFVVSAEPASFAGSVQIEPPQPALDTRSPQQQAEQLLASARQKGDLSGECDALADLGLILLREGKATAAIPILQAALHLTPQLGDRSREADILGHLGLAFLAAGQPGCALQLLQQSLACSRACGDRWAEKLALANLGSAHAVLHEPNGAILFFEQALSLCREVGDRLQEAESLWHLAIQKAELGLREDAISWAQVALNLFQDLRHPQCELLASQLQRFRDGSNLGNGDPRFSQAPGSHGDRPIIASGWTALPAPPADQPVSGPGILRMAISAVKSLGGFVGSGFKTVAPDIHRQRLETCGSCVQHTGLRCRVCGCFTRVKAWMPHESCPLGKWPGQV